MRLTQDNPQRVLILEDDPVQAQLFERILIGGNYEAEAVGDPHSLLTTLDSTPVPDLMLIDILLPRIDGLTTCVRLAEDPRWCLVPTILVTASGDPALRNAVERLPLPPEAVLAKPVDPMTLLRGTRRILASEELPLRLRTLQRRRLSVTLRLNGKPDPGRGDRSGGADQDRYLVRLRQSLDELEAEIDRIEATLRRDNTLRA